MSTPPAKKLEIPERFRNFRTRLHMSQEQMGEHLCVTGNYIYLIESGKKVPGPSLVKLFESIENSPLYDPSLAPIIIPPNPFYAMLKTESLHKNFAELAEKLVETPKADRKPIIGQLKEMMDEIEQREVASSGPLSEVPRAALKAVSRPGTKRGS
jgi:transcriptional regulator with XRE-family HTH domain